MKRLLCSARRAGEKGTGKADCLQSVGIPHISTDDIFLQHQKRYELERRPKWSMDRRLLASFPDGAYL